MICRTWSQPDANHTRGLCTNTLFSEGHNNTCVICADPIGNLGTCSNCILPPPAIYNVSITMVPVRLHTFYPWLPEYADLGLVEDPPGWVTALINDGESTNPGKCGYSKSYNLKQTGDCVYASDELESVVSSLGLVPGAFNTSPVYDISCRTGTSINPTGSNRRNRVVLRIEGSTAVQYRLEVNWIVERRDPVFILNPVFPQTATRFVGAPDRDCHKPVSHTLTGPYPSAVPQPGVGGALAVIWSTSISPGAQ